MEALTPELLEYASASRAYASEEVPGDSSVVILLPDSALVALVDGLGHGEPANEVARRTITLLGESPLEHPADAVQRCHEHLRGTRGVVLSLARFDGPTDTMTWLGVGNVAGAVMRAQDPTGRQLERLLLRGGVVGLRLPALRASMVRVFPGDTLALATDGVRPAFANALSCDEPPDHLARRILAEYAIGSDDATVVIARYRGTLP